MDYTIVDISKLGVGQIKVGDWVEFIGKYKFKEISRKSQPYLMKF